MYHYKCKLLKVVDGDTIDAEIDLGFKICIKERIRLTGIDAPESRTRNKAEKSWGLASKQFIINILEENNNIFELKTKLQKKGKYGRILGNIVLISPAGNEISVNDLLIENNLAIPYEGGNKEDSRIKHGVAELWNTFYISKS